MRLLDLNPLMLGEVGETQAPGVSTFQSGKWLHGAEAFDLCRQDPQSVRFHVWENLSLSPQKLPGGMRHLADVALAQLKALCANPAQGEWVVLTPSHWTKEQLQVFLGVAASCQMDVRALMPRVLAVNADLALAQTQVVAWEWDWYRLSRVVLSRGDEGWGLESVHEVSDAGVMDFFRRESRVIARYALERHRIDPLYTGQTEQQLFEGWWDWHRGASDWSFTTAGIRMDFVDEASTLRDLHPMLPSPAEGNAPAMLAHCLGWGQDKVEGVPEISVVDRLGDLSQPGARWKDTLPLGAERVQQVFPVTHLVVNGIAEKVTDSNSWVPGQLIQAEDGREALAIHVPED